MYMYTIGAPWVGVSLIKWFKLGSAMLWLKMYMNEKQEAVLS